MALHITRVLFVLACITMGVVWAAYVTDIIAENYTGQVPMLPGAFLGGGVGLLIAMAMLVLVGFVTQEVFERISPALTATAIAMMVGWAAGQWILLMFWPEADQNVRIFLVVTLVLVFGYMGISLGLTRASNWESLIQEVHRRQVQHGSPTIVDTSVIIDGRISDISDTGFLDGTLIIPRFVLGELQNIADSADVLRRAKGRRGLDIVKQLQEKRDKLQIVIVHDDYPEVREVDSKLLKLAAEYRAKVMTNDYNLNKVAQIEGVAVLNINDLANALKPAVLPDEHMEVKIIKEGKEPFQGVGYLDDGTMVVVDGGKEQVGNRVTVIVTSVLQTAAGRMIFGKLSGVLP